MAEIKDDLELTLEILYNEITESGDVFEIKSTEHNEYYEHCINIFHELSDLCHNYLSKCILLHKYGPYDYKNIIIELLNEESSQKSNKVSTIKSFENCLAQIDIVTQMKKELTQKLYDEELETLKNSHHQKIIEINYEFYNNITSKIIDTEIKKRIYFEESKQIFSESHYVSPLVDKTPILGIPRPFPQYAGPHVSYRLPDYLIYEDIYKIKTELYRKEINGKLKDKFDEAYKNLNKRLD
ncbi:hypothetical protein HZS_724, partial [Henneguya salminicola]